MTDPSTNLSTKLEPRVEELFDRYEYPGWLWTHSLVVGRICRVFVASLADGRTLETPGTDVALAGYLHDLGRSPLFAKDQRDHNELSALVLAAEGLPELSELARRHPIYSVLHPAIAPRTLAEKLVYIADRRGGQGVEPLEERAADTAARHPRYAASVRQAIPLAKELEREVFAALTFGPDELAGRVAAFEGGLRVG